MLIRRPERFRSSEITGEAVYLNRRTFMVGAAAALTLLPGESDEYRRARDELLQAEIELRRQEEAVAAQRRRLPLGGVVPEDYVFEEWDADAGGPRAVRMSELFAEGKDTLFLYSFMFIPGSAQRPLEQGCPSCTSIIAARS